MCLFLIMMKLNSLKLRFQISNSMIGKNDLHSLMITEMSFGFFVQG
jgi:hypothetical protein